MSIKSTIKSFIEPKNIYTLYSSSSNAHSPSHTIDSFNISIQLNHIAKMIEEMLAEQNGTLEIRRSELAGRMGCAPSQINYVITSRFTPDRCYLIESRRGGGGYIRIVKKQLSGDEYLMHCFHAIGNELDEGTALAILRNLADNNFIGAHLLRVAAALVSQAALSRVPTELKKSVRADIFRQFLLSLMQ
jgi:transcriptional regulator CtsR